MNLSENVNAYDRHPQSAIAIDSETTLSLIVNNEKSGNNDYTLKFSRLHEDELILNCREQIQGLLDCLATKKNDWISYLQTVHDKNPTLLLDSGSQYPCTRSSWNHEYDSLHNAGISVCLRHDVIHFKTVMCKAITICTGDSVKNRAFLHLVSLLDINHSTANADTSGLMVFLRFYGANKSECEYALYRSKVYLDDGLKTFGLKSNRDNKTSETYMFKDFLMGAGDSLIAAKFSEDFISLQAENNHSNFKLELKKCTGNYLLNWFQFQYQTAAVSCTFLGKHNG